MAIQIKEKLRKDIKKASKALGVGEQEIIDRALLLYLVSIQQNLELENEFRAWDMLSDEALQGMA